MSCMMRVRSGTIVPDAAAAAAAAAAVAVGTGGSERGGDCPRLPATDFVFTIFRWIKIEER